MTFVADEDAGRTYDAERGAELFLISGGSDGSKHFELRYADRTSPFSAELLVVASDDGLSWCVRLCEVEDRTIIAEALRAYGWGHGFWADKICGVKFLERRKRLFSTRYEWIDA
ncbi:MAG: hypothetical protein PGN12_14850 [Sphingomonas phyllosphaerae]